MDRVEELYAKFLGYCGKLNSISRKISFLYIRNLVGDIRFSDKIMKLHELYYSSLEDQEFVRLLGDLDSLINAGLLSGVRSRNVLCAKRIFERNLREPLDLRLQIEKSKMFGLASYGSGVGLSGCSGQLKEMFKLQMRKARLLSNGGDCYTSLVQEYCPDLTRSILEGLLSDLKQRIKKIICETKCTQSPHILDRNLQEYLNSNYFAKNLLDSIGLGPSLKVLVGGRFGSCLYLDRGNVGIVTDRNRGAYLHVPVLMHEGGHGLFWQNLPRGFTFPHNVCMAMNETSAMFYEQYSFSNQVFETINNRVFADTGTRLRSQHDWINARNYSGADYYIEVLAVMIVATETEMLLIDGEIEIEMANKIMILKMKEMGLFASTPSNYYWLCGLWGYMPAYIVSIIMSTVLYKRAHDEVMLGGGDQLDVLEWMKNNFYCHGHMGVVEFIDTFWNGSFPVESWEQETRRRITENSQEYRSVSSVAELIA